MAPGKLRAAARKRWQAILLRELDGLGGPATARHLARLVVSALEDERQQALVDARQRCMEYARHEEAVGEQLREGGPGRMPVDTGASAAHLSRAAGARSCAALLSLKGA